MHRIEPVRSCAVGAPAAVRPLEVIIPFTTVKMSQAALRYAEQLCSGVQASVRVVKVVVVPFPLDLEKPAVPPRFVAQQLSSLRCNLPLTIDIRLGRERIPALTSAFAANTIALMVTPKRWWTTKEERLAKKLKRAGRDVLLTYMEETKEITDVLERVASR
ncbi:MAG: hypothetical protein JO061_24330 [Acidobacteriaceae bacterium]|nr:hypothetical protein [Acidobacteriaceae bacterium]